MILNPFVAGILATIFAELIIIDVAAIIVVLSKPKKKESNDGTEN